MCVKDFAFLLPDETIEKHIVAGGLRMESSKGKMERPHPDANIWALHSAATEVKAKPGLLGYVIIFLLLFKRICVGACYN